MYLPKYPLHFHGSRTHETLACAPACYDFRIETHNMFAPSPVLFNDCGERASQHVPNPTAGYDRHSFRDHRGCYNAAILLPTAAAVRAATGRAGGARILET